MIHILYLAAGSGRRFGSNKLLAPLNGKPLYAWGLDTLTDFVHSRTDCDLTVVSRYPEILQAARQRRLRAVNSPLSAQGLSYSIRAGIQAVQPLDEADFLLFVLSDQPHLTTDALRRMLESAIPGTLGATACFEGTPGSPTLFSARLVPELLELQGDQGGRRVLNRYPDETIPVELGCAAELLDVDTPADLMH